MAKGKGIEVSVLSQDVGERLQEFYDGMQFPFVRRNADGSFSVCVHSKPFGKAPLTEEEIAQRAAQKARDKKQREAEKAAKAKQRAEKKAQEEASKAKRREDRKKAQIAKLEAKKAEILAK